MIWWQFTDTKYICMLTLIFINNKMEYGVVIVKNFRSNLIIFT